MKRLLFYADENLRQHSVKLLLRPHEVLFTDLQSRDPAIVMGAEQAGAIILTSDTWFHTQLRQDPYYIAQHRARTKSFVEYQRAGVFLVSGEWQKSREQIQTWLPLIETVAAIFDDRPGKRVVVNIGKHNTLQVDL